MICHYAITITITTTITINTSCNYIGDTGLLKFLGLGSGGSCSIGDLQPMRSEPPTATPEI